ncbi:unnamed protein product [Orchesella dallaii]|uniref:Uncharacterized protein n=1 Tax=Orchesella dallaii TaxID=48710 RepID=A0ABP1RQS3_9HEXA
MWTIPEGLVINSNIDKFKRYNLNFIILRSASSQQTNRPTSSTETHGFHEFHWHPEPTQRKSNVSLLQDGTLVWDKEEKERYFYPRDRFCVSDLSGDSVTFRTSDEVSSSQLGRGDEGFCFTELRLFHFPPLNCIGGIAVTSSLIVMMATNWDLKDVQTSAHSKIPIDEAQICASINMRVSFIMGFLYFSELAFELAGRITPFDKIELLFWTFAPADVINGLMGVFVFLFYLAGKFQVKKMKVNSDFHATAADADTTMTSEL